MTQEEFFKRYTYDVVEDRIGGGGFGTVYKAYDNVLHHEVAIKVAEVKTVANGKTFSLKDEVEALSGLPDHPNIAYYEKEKLYTFKTPTGVCDFAVMQYYPDGNLSNAIKQGLTAEQKEDIATQLLEGIDFLHKHKVVHRDLKPGNILIVKHGGKVIPLITDFGLSKAAGVVDGSVFSNSFGAGTPRYSSPEQLQGNPLRFNTDLWSYGAILYELFTGQQLFTAGSGAANTAQADMEIYNKIVNGNVQSLGKMPEKWRKVAERCLVVDPTKRAKDATELFAIIKGDDDETEITERESPQPPLVKGEVRSDAGAKPNNPILEPRQASPSERGAGGSKTPPESNDKPGNKKALWIGLGIAAAAVVALLVLLLKPKQEPTSTNPDTQAYEACQTVADYRAYLSDYGRNALHYSDAKAFVEQYVADSVKRAQDSLAQVQVRQMAQQQSESELKAQTEAEKKEDAAYQKCNTIAACDSYLKTYPQGRYVDEVRAKKAKLEKEQLKADLQNTGETPEQCFNNGVDYYNSKNYKEAVKWYRKSADQGYANAQCNLGYMYEVGRGVSQSYSEAVKWYRSAAEQGAAQAQCNLGYMYEFGRGVTQSYSEAEKWYRKAADQGHSKAQFNLAVLYWGGLGVSQNDSEAVKWYRKSADQGYASAQCNLGYMYEVGRGVTQSYTEAVKWYRSAAEQGESQAQCNLGCMYEFGRGVTQSYSEAVKWYRKAAEQGHSRAQYNLGVLYNNGSGVSQDKVEAKKWISKAAAQGFQDAVEFLNNVNF